MNRSFRLPSILIGALGVFALPLAGARAQGQEPQPGMGSTVTIEYYYKLAPGGTSEWLALYLKNHNPILRQMIMEGLILSEKAYERRFHAESPAWDYKVVMVWRDWQALQQAQQREPEIIRSLYPDKAGHDREEKRRWELTEKHWDDVLKEVPLETPR